MTDNYITMRRAAFLASIEQAKDAGYRQAKADLLGGHTPAQDFTASRPIMDDEDAIKADFAAIAAR